MIVTVAFGVRLDPHRRLALRHYRFNKSPLLWIGKFVDVAHAAFLGMHEPVDIPEVTLIKVSSLMSADINSCWICQQLAAEAQIPMGKFSKA